MKIVLVSKWSLDIEQCVEFNMSVLISPLKSLISLCWVTYFYKIILQPFGKVEKGKTLWQLTLLHIFM